MKEYRFMIIIGDCECGIMSCGAFDYRQAEELIYESIHKVFNELPYLDIPLRIILISE